jgi:hypothetical protein
MLSRSRRGAGYYAALHADSALETFIDATCAFGDEIDKARSQQCEVTPLLSTPPATADPRYRDHSKTHLFNGIGQTQPKLTTR